MREPRRRRRDRRRDPAQPAAVPVEQTGRQQRTVDEQLYPGAVACQLGPVPRIGGGWERRRGRAARHHADLGDGQRDRGERVRGVDRDGAGHRCPQRDGVELGPGVEVGGLLDGAVGPAEMHPVRIRGQAPLRLAVAERDGHLPAAQVAVKSGRVGPRVPVLVDPQREPGRRWRRGVFVGRIGAVRRSVPCLPKRSTGRQR